MFKSVSFYRNNINTLLVQKQKEVFDKFGIDHTQVLTDKDHNVAIDLYLMSEEWDTVFLFDIDCIPLKEKIFEYALDKIKDGNTLFGAAQMANHIPNSLIYVSPAFMVLTRSVYEKLGRPSFKETHRGDVGAELTYLSYKYKVHVDVLYPTHAEVPIWNLNDVTKFGHGTNYEDMVYHAFESRFGNTVSRFITKCDELLKSSL